MGTRLSINGFSVPTDCACETLLSALGRGLSTDSYSRKAAGAVTTQRMGPALASRHPSSPPNPPTTHSRPKAHHIQRPGFPAIRSRRGRLSNVAIAQRQVALRPLHCGGVPLVARHGRLRRCRGPKDGQGFRSILPRTWRPFDDWLETSSRTCSLHRRRLRGPPAAHQSNALLILVEPYDRSSRNPQGTQPGRPVLGRQGPVAIPGKPILGQGNLRQPDHRTEDECIWRSFMSCLSLGLLVWETCR